MVLDICSLLIGLGTATDALCPHKGHLYLILLRFVIGLVKGTLVRFLIGIILL